MNGRQFLDAFDLDDQLSRDDYVGANASSEFLILVEDRNRRLAAESNLCELELMADAVRVLRLFLRVLRVLPTKIRLARLRKRNQNYFLQKSLTSAIVILSM